MSERCIRVYGFHSNKWQSLERTRRWYERALSAEFDLRLLEGHEQGNQDCCEAMLDYTGDVWWKLRTHPHYPVILPIHGGAVLDNRRLRGLFTILETTDLLVVNCSADQVILEKLFDRQTPLILRAPLPVDHDVFRPMDKQQCRSAIDLPRDAAVVGFVGRIVPQKNLHQFLRALSELRRDLHPRAVFGVIVGNFWVDYPVLNYSTEGYQDSICLLVKELDLERHIAYYPGNLGDEEMCVIYNAIDLLFHPTNSIDENFGYVAVEAMACGTPVIAASYGGLKDTIVPGETGCLMNTWVSRSGIRMDLIAGYRDLRHLLTAPDVIDDMSTRSLAHARLQYNQAEFAARLNLAVRNAIDERRASRHTQVATRPAGPFVKTSSFLPLLEHPWEEYAEAVSDYVSTTTPIVTADSYVRLAAPVKIVDGRICELVDPAWPAAFPVREEELDIVLRCKLTPQRAGDLASDFAGDFDLMSRLVDDGLLLCSNS